MPIFIFGFPITISPPQRTVITTAPAPCFPDATYAPGAINQGVVYSTPQQQNVSASIVRFDPSYIKTFPGRLKVTQCVNNAICMICIMVSPCMNYCASNNWFNFVATTGLSFTLCLLSLYFFHIIEKFKSIPWLAIELLYCTVWALFYMLASVIIAVKGGRSDAYIAAAFFGFVGVILYAVDGYIKHECWKNGVPAQGEIPQQQMSTTPTSPSYPA